MWWIFFLFGLDTEVVVPQTNIFSPLTVETAARRDDGAFFLFDRFEQDIWLYDPATGDKQRIARKGSGPGELNRTNRIALFDGELFVFSAAQIQVFDREGVYVRHIRLPPGLFVKKTATGWVGQKMRLSDGRLELAFYNEDLTESKRFVTWKENQPRMTMIRPDKPYRPILFPEMGDFLISEDGAYLYYRLPEKRTIHVVSTADQSEVGQIEFERRFLFDEARGEAVVADIQAKYPNTKVIGVFPEYFPYTNGFHWDPRGFFMVAQYQGKDMVLLRYRPTGEAVETARLSVEAFERIIDVEGEFFYVSYQNGGEDMGIKKIRQSQATEFFQNHPIED